MPQWLSKWLQRHRHPLSLGLHIVGIPLTIAAVVLAILQLAEWRWDLWYRPLFLVIVGYLLQWIGHAMEGNDMGEIILVKKWLGRPYTAVSPRYAPQDEPPPSQETKTIRNNP